MCNTTAIIRHALAIFASLEIKAIVAFVSVRMRNISCAHKTTLWRFVYRVSEEDFDEREIELFLSNVCTLHKNSMTPTEEIAIGGETFSHSI